MFFEKKMIETKKKAKRQHMKCVCNR